MSASVKWQQDSNGNYYYWAPGENCYIYYPSGRRYYPATKRWTEPPLPSQGGSQAPQASQQIPRATVAAQATAQSGQQANRDPNRDPLPYDSLSRSASNQRYTTSREPRTSFSSGGSNDPNIRPAPILSQHQSSTVQAVGGQAGWQGKVTTHPSWQGYSRAPAGEGQAPAPSAFPGESGGAPGTVPPGQGTGAGQASHIPKRRDWHPSSSAHSTATSHSATKPAPGSSTRGTQKQIHGQINSSLDDPLDYEALDPRYKRRKHDFFKVFRVFKMHWAEPTNEDATVVTKRVEPLPRELEKWLPKDVVRDKRFGQYIFSKIRWFIVVRQNKDNCLCVPIVTYNGKGVEKDVVKNEHAIVHTTKDAPRPTPDEKPKRGEKPMRTPIRIQTDEKGDKLANMARIDYSRVYTVEHNIKAMAFGCVHEKSQKNFQFDFLNVFMGEQGYKDWIQRQAEAEANEDTESGEDDSEASEDEGGQDDEDVDNEDDNNNHDSEYDDNGSKRRQH